MKINDIPESCWQALAIGLITSLFVLRLRRLRPAWRNILLTPLGASINMVHHALNVWMLHCSKRATHETLELASFYADDAEPFFTRTRQAFELIKAHDPINNGRVRRYLRLITDFGIGSHFDPKLRAFHVDRFELANESIESYAADLVHEAVHGRLATCRIGYRDNEARHERICQRVQVRFLSRIGQHALAQTIGFADEWWNPTARRVRAADHLQSLTRDWLKDCNVPAQIFGRGLKGLQQIAPLAHRDESMMVARSHRQGDTEILEFDDNGDGKVDRWIYATDRTVLAECDLQATGRIDYRAYFENGRMTRCEYDQDGDGAMEWVGSVSWRKQGTESDISWCSNEGEVEFIDSYAGQQLIGRVTIKDSAVTSVEGRTRHRIGERIPNTKS